MKQLMLIVLFVGALGFAQGKKVLEKFALMIRQRPHENV